MTNHDQYVLMNKQSGQPVFKLFYFEDLCLFREVQRLNQYSLIWIQEGQGKATVDYNTFDYDEHTLFSFTPYQPFLFGAEEKSKGYVIHFHSDFFCIHKHHQEIACNGILFNNLYDVPFVKVTESATDSFGMIIKEIQRDIDNDPLAMNESVLSYLKLFLIHASRLRQEEESPKEEKEEEAFIPQKLKDMIEAHFRTMHTPKDYANSLHISQKALAKISKKYFNKTMTALIADRVIMEAKRELYLTSKPVREIAYELGYEDEFYFSRFFKKNTSITPTMFRQTVGFAKAEQ